LELEHTRNYVSKNTPQALNRFANEALKEMRDCLMPCGLNCTAVYKRDTVKRDRNVTKVYSEYAVTIQPLEMME
jgi:hypothetical protein